MEGQGSEMSYARRGQSEENWLLCGMTRLDMWLKSALVERWASLHALDRHGHRQSRNSKMTKRWITARRRKRSGRIEDSESELGARCVCPGRSLVFYSEDVGKQPEFCHEESGSIWFLFYKNDSGSMQRIFSVAEIGARLFLLPALVVRKDDKG